MNSHWDDYDDPNDQSLVIKIEYNKASVMLAGDTSFKPWKEKILTNYDNVKIKSDILLASHHGSLSFFNDPSDEQYYYTEHIKIIKPQMTIISVGPNSNDLPDRKAVELYKKYSTGSKQGNKVFSTENKGHMKLVLKDNGGWRLSTKQ
jgi:beta-lactamase superfamily II metal-dependent hydrolase